MLTKFQVKNFKKFSDNIVFDLSKKGDYDFNEEVIRNNNINFALIYGSNGSGKSNLGLAIFDILFHITDYSMPNHLYQDYLYGNGILENSAEFIYNLLLDGYNIEYRYIKRDKNNLIEEELKVNNEILIYMNRDKKIQKINIPEGNTLKTEGFFETNLSLIKYILKNTIPKTEVLEKFNNFINKMNWFRSLQTNSYMGYFLEDNSVTETILSINKIEKLNISSEEKEKKYNENLKKLENFLLEGGIKLSLIQLERDGKRTIYVQFKSPNKEEKLIKLLNIASSGTLALLVFYVFFIRIEKNSFLFIDEFDAFYHYKLTKFIIKKLKEKKNVQIILTTHSTNLMDNELLRPDCYFILKDNKIKSFPELTNKELREEHNIEKLFKSGAFDE
ncbi:AAA family ATPase [Fusobacterium watanabei]|uniref:AAA family ATPase n=1 Tax=Fusobacterium watanabei TaxID=2686067 RepID=UPI003B588D8E